MNEPRCFHVSKWALERTSFPKFGNAKAGIIPFKSLFADICQQGTVGFGLEDIDTVKCLSLVSFPSVVLCM